MGHNGMVIKMTKIVMLFAILNANGNVIYDNQKPFALDMQTCIEAIPGIVMYLENYAAVYQNEEIHVSAHCEYQ